jgi:carboxylesterase type B
MPTLNPSTNPTTSPTSTPTQPPTLLPTVLPTGKSDPTVCTEGSVCFHGTWVESSSIRFASFQGIKYGKPPTGELRFRNPQPHKYEAGDFNVSETSTVICAQLGLDGGLLGQEDCLLLNVYVPDVALLLNSTKLPVMVWFHGGGFQVGDSLYETQGPHPLMDRGVVIVTVHYRLAVLGFLSMGSEIVPGNAGLRDQVMALKWVSETISHFGGDPDLVTIFGESAGSISVHFHILSPLSNGLFQKAIMQSGVAVYGFVSYSPEEALGHTSLLTKKVGCALQENVLSCMQGLEVHNILAASTSSNSTVYWVPIVDSGFTDDSFLPGYPEQLMSSGEFNTNIDVMIGTNKADGSAYFFAGNSWEEVKVTFLETAPYFLFGFRSPSLLSEQILNKTNMVLDYYLDSTDSIDNEDLNSILEMMTDAWFLHGTWETVKWMAEQNLTVYHYILTYEGQFDFASLIAGFKVGAGHADDLLYLWDFLPLNEDDKLVRDIMVSAWTSFAANGDPTPPDSGLSWEKQSCSNCVQAYWNISGPFPEMASSNDINERMEFWNTLGNERAMSNSFVTRAPTSLATSTLAPTSQCRPYLNDVNDIVFTGVGLNCRAGIDSS